MLGFGPEMIFGIPGLIIALTIHEYAHARVATYCGDFTPRMQGRLTLNPLTHIDPWGLIMLFLFRFGWARPVMVNPRNFRNMRRDDILVSVAGPVSNILMALIAGILGALIYKMGYMESWLYQIIWMTIIYNVNFAIFNMIPIPPLDGSRILINILPYEMARQYAQIERYSMAIFIGFILLANTHILGSILTFFTMPIIGLIRIIMMMIIGVG
ncbi:site-2 protease family protein [Pectinatus brassicae]|uniref:Zn-dependent protease n=1 Tax=Pectinatus brassicae TaxID=862415 RepID=A0A840UPT3_9FIRM|nr:site-2 protease family protein [Pectinatus brassicae]MBB5336728.1 Zn-dependent protease [Pectinatus brassicae]